MPLTPHNFFVLYGLAIAWVALVVLVSVIYRRSRGKPVFRPRFKQPLFLETWRSGHSLHSLITRLGGARNCLWVAVNDQTLQIGPHFPFNLMFLPEIYHMEYKVPGSAIRSVERQTGLFGIDRIVLTVEARAGENESFVIWLRDPYAFIKAVAMIRPTDAPP